MDEHFQCPLLPMFMTLKEVSNKLTKWRLMSACTKRKFKRFWWKFEVFYFKVYQSNFFSQFLFSADHQFGCVEYWISSTSICFLFWRQMQLKKTKQIFKIWNSTCPNSWVGEDIKKQWQQIDFCDKNLENMLWEVLMFWITYH